MQKTGSLAEEAGSVAAVAGTYADRYSNAKEASIGVAKGRAEQLAVQLSKTRLPNGDTLISGYESVKQASLWLSDHANALNVLELVLNHVSAVSKEASFDVGRPVDGRSPEVLDNDTQFRQDIVAMGFRP